MAVYKHKKTGRWVAQVWDADKGRNVQLGTRATRREAIELEMSVGPAPSSVTVSEWRERWLEEADVRGSSRENYRYQTAAFAKAYGDRRLASIDRTIARSWASRHPSTVQQVSTMFAAAIYEDTPEGGRLLRDNPFSKLNRRKVARRDLRADWLEAGDIDKLEQAALTAHGPHLGATVAAMIRFAAETGIRPGEMFLLEEADLDLDGNVLMIRRTFSKDGTINPPKNGKVREVYLSSAAIAAAQSAPRYDEVTAVPTFDGRGRRVLGDEAWLPQGSPRIFSTKSGQQWRQPSLSTHWSPVRNLAGRPSMAFYELRHFCATRLLNAGLTDEEVAVQLGNTPDMIRTVYGHPNNRRAIARVGEALEGAA